MTALGKRIFEDLIPPPDFLNVPVAGIDISDRKIRYVEFGKKPSHYFLKQFGEIELPLGAITGGYVNNIQDLQPIFSRLKDEKNLLNVNITISEEKAFLFKAQVPKVEGEDMKSAVEFKIEENVPFALSEAVFDYKVIEDVADKDHINIGVAVLPLKTVEAYLTIVEGSGLKVRSLDIEAQAIVSSVIKRDDRRTCMIVNFKENNTGIYIISDGIIHFTSTIPIGGNTITRAIEKSFSISKEEAEKMKEEKGFVKNRDNMALFSSLVSTVSALQDEIKKVRLYWETHSERGLNIEEVVLCGKDGGIEGFVDYLSVTLKIDVSVADVWQNVLDPEVSVPKLHFLDSLDYAAAIGSALPTI